MKGGVGKTTTVVSLSETLAAEVNTSVLVVDIDTQANASYCLAGDALLSELIENDRTIDEFFSRRLVDNVPCFLKDFVRSQISHVTHLDRQIDVSLLASSPYLRLTEREIIHALTKRRYSMGAIEGRAIEVLQPAMQNFRQSYDFIIFDCAPGISAFTAAAMSLSDLIIIPTIPDFLSYLGLAAFSGSVLKDVEKRGWKGSAYILITRKNNTNQHNKYAERIKKDAKISVFDTVIPESASLPKALSMIDGQHPTYLQKYTGVDQMLSSLAAEVKGALK